MSVSRSAPCRSIASQSSPLLAETFLASLTHLFSCLGPCWYRVSESRCSRNASHMAEDDLTDLVDAYLPRPHGGAERRLADLLNDTHVRMVTCG